MTLGIIIAEWTGEALKPLPRFDGAANAELVVGERYEIEPSNLRSMRNHRHQWAGIKTAWLNLPESIAAEFPTAEHLRKRALIECGYRDEFRFAGATTRDTAIAVAACVRGNDYAVVSFVDRAAVVFIPKSQSVKAMGNTEFKRSKQAVLEWCWQQVGLKPDYGSAA